MKYHVYTIIHVRVVVEAETETKAFTMAEERAREWMAEQDQVSGKVIVAAREADEVE